MDSWRSEGKMNTKNYLQIDIRERAKQSWVEEQKYPKRLHKAVAQDRKRWSESLEALSTYWRDETW